VPDYRIVAAEPIARQWLLKGHMHLTQRHNAELSNLFCQSFPARVKVTQNPVVGHQPPFRQRIAANGIEIITRRIPLAFRVRFARIQGVRSVQAPGPGRVRV
jgi:hypothetical protein